VRRCGVQVEVILFYVFTVIALGVGKTEQALLQNRVCSVPKSYGEAKVLFIVGEAGEAVLTPTIGAGASVVV
jgi:hypothetical protein